MISKGLFSIRGMGLDILHPMPWHSSSTSSHPVVGTAAVLGSPGAAPSPLPGAVPAASRARALGRDMASEGKHGQNGAKLWKSGAKLWKNMEKCEKNDENGWKCWKMDENEWKWMKMVE